MGSHQSGFRKFNKKLASLKLAVFVILAMAAISAWGTIVESMYNDARRAQELVYHSWYSYGTFALLAINLIAVIIDRYPWKWRHIGFISAHVGILILLAGSLMTRYFGVDGSMALKIGETKNRVSLQNTDVLLYSSLMTGDYRKLFEEEVEFLKSPPSKSHPYEVLGGQDEIKITEFKPYSIPQFKVKSSSNVSDGPGLRFQISNSRVSESEWLVLGANNYVNKALGPASVIFAKKGLWKYAGGNALLLEYTQGVNELDYTVFSDKLGGKTKWGKVKAGQSLPTGWMDLTFRLLKFLPHAFEEYEYVEAARAGDGVTPSIRLEFQGKEYWTGLNSSLKLFSNTAGYVLVFANRLIELDFALKLNEFRVGRYQGTRRAMSYESDVQVVANKSIGDKVTISMNEPLKTSGFTFYQSSFQENEFGQPELSILSVNRDPGRFWKYLGSLMIVFGIFHLFYLRDRKKRKAA